MDPAKRNRILGLLGAGAKYGVELPYGRSQESEADRYGLYLMAVAGFDPREAVRFWERMEKQSGGKAPPEFMSTHPGHGTRIGQLKRLMPEAEKLYRGSPDRDLPDRKLDWPGS
jgi:predicted Zn-dependent protease